VRWNRIVMVAAGLWNCLAFGQVEIPEGFEIVEIASSDYGSGFPKINNCGQIVFDLQVGRDFTTKEIFRYDNGSLRRITENNIRDQLAAINNSGTVVWLRADPNPPSRQVILYRDGIETLLDQHRLGVSGIAINNLGHIAWTRFRRSECPLAQDLVLWDGQTIRRITPKDRFNDQSPDLNDLGWIVWGHSDNCVQPWVGDVRLYRDGQIEVLPNDTLNPQGPTVNNVGQIAWARNPGIMLWQNGNVELLADFGRKSSLNNLGDLYFWNWHDDIGVMQPWLYRVSDGNPHFYRLVNEQAWHHAGDINDWVEATWPWVQDPANGDWTGGIMLLRRIRTGDAQFDGGIDLDDHAAFVDCMTGPGRMDRLCDCRFLDIDHDGDVDLGDFARFQNAFMGD